MKSFRPLGLALLLAGLVPQKARAGVNCIDACTPVGSDLACALQGAALGCDPVSSQCTICTSDPLDTSCRVGGQGRCVNSRCVDTPFQLGQFPDAGLPDALGQDVQSGDAMTDVGSGAMDAGTVRPDGAAGPDASDASIGAPDVVAGDSGPLVLPDRVIPPITLEPPPDDDDGCRGFPGFGVGPWVLVGFGLHGVRKVRRRRSPARGTMPPPSRGRSSTPTGGEPGGLGRRSP